MIQSGRDTPDKNTSKINLFLIQFTINYCNICCLHTFTTGWVHKFIIKYSIFNETYLIVLLQLKIAK